MGFHGKENSQKNGSPNIKKKKFTVKKLAKKLLKKTHRHKSDDSEALLEADDTGSNVRTSGRSIEVLPGEETNQNCSCSTFSEDEVADLDRVHCDVCRGTPGRRTRRHRHVRFSPDVISSESQNALPTDDNSDQHKRKKHRKLRKARKLTWKVMKKSWKYMKFGLEMITIAPGLPTGPVQAANIVNNPMSEMGRRSRPY